MRNYYKFTRKNKPINYLARRVNSIGRDAALRRPDSAARCPYLQNNPLPPHGATVSFRPGEVEMAELFKKFALEMLERPQLRIGQNARLIIDAVCISILGTCLFWRLGLSQNLRYKTETILVRLTGPFPAGKFLHCILGKS